MTGLPITPSQTVGPFFAIALPWADGPHVVPEGTPGAITIAGFVTDGAGEPVPDALVETWQAAPDGSFGHPDDPRRSSAGGAASAAAGSFRGFGRCPTGPDGGYRILTLPPGLAALRRRPHRGAAPGRVRVRARPARPGRDQDLLSRRGSGQRRRPGAVRTAGPCAGATP